MARPKTDLKLAGIIGQNIEFAMTKRGLTKHALAKAVGISQNSITHFIKGKGTPSVATLLRVSDVLNVSVAFLVTDHN